MSDQPKPTGEWTYEKVAGLLGMSEERSSNYNLVVLRDAINSELAAGNHVVYERLEKSVLDLSHPNFKMLTDQLAAEREKVQTLMDELRNIVNCDLIGMRRDFGDDTDSQFRLWAQNRAKAALAKVNK